MPTGCTPFFDTLGILKKEIANMGNEQMRRCRIGKVREKQPAPIHRPTFGPMTSEDLLKQLYPAWGWRPSTVASVRYNDGGIRC